MQDGFRHELDAGLFYTVTNESAFAVSQDQDSYIISDKAEELLGVLDLHTEGLYKILLCPIPQLMKSHLIIDAKIMVDCMGMHAVFSLLSENCCFSCTSHEMAAGLQGISLSVILVFSEVK